MWKVVVIVFMVGVSAVLLLASRRPDSFHVQRSLRMQAPAEKIYALIQDMQAFQRWNPYAKKDAEMRTSYYGPASGVGAGQRFEGKRSGTGSLEIVGTQAPSELRMRLDMSAPLQAHNDIRFTLQPEGNATTVTWAMDGASPLIAKLAGLFFSMDHMIGADFETGLADLKALAERP